MATFQVFNDDADSKIYEAASEEAARDAAARDLGYNDEVHMTYVTERRSPLLAIDVSDGQRYC